MGDHRKLKCTVLKYVRVPSPRYGLMFAIMTRGSLDKKEMYEVSISNFLTCNYKHFKFISTHSVRNKKQKWMSYKHLYSLLQEFFCCTKEDVFIHCPRCTPNEVKLLLGRAKWLK